MIVKAPAHRHIVSKQIPGVSFLSPPFAKDLAPQFAPLYDIGLHMKGQFSTREAAGKLGVTILTLQRHVSAKTVEAPPLVTVGGVKVRLWSERDIHKAKKVLAATRPGRKKKQ